MIVYSAGMTAHALNMTFVFLLSQCASEISRACIFERAYRRARTRRVRCACGRARALDESARQRFFCAHVRAHV